MWLINKDSDKILWLELSSKDHSHFLLPIFTSPDVGIGFVNLSLDDDTLVTFRRITTINQLMELKLVLESKPNSALVLDPPPPYDLDDEEQLIYWSDIEFIDVINTITNLAMTYGEDRALSIFNNYLNTKSDINIESDV